MEEKRCFGCMKLKGDEPICPHCGYDETKKNDIHQLPAGTVLKEQYLVGRVLGQGGFGITYLAWDLYLDTPVAVKEYYPTGVVMRECSVTTNVSICTDEGEARFRNCRERFLREAKMLARFSQTPEIVQVRNFFLANNTAYIVMEYVEGTTLKEYVKQNGGRLSMEKTMSILSPIMKALDMVHKAGVIHRDISPDNIMLLPNGGVKLLDFGAVRDMTSASISTEAILKQGFAPIEQYQKRGSLGPWTDVYAISATIYYCITGEIPLDSPDRLLSYEDLDLEKKLPELPENQRRALEDGMQLRSENRTQSVEELYRALSAAPMAASKPTPAKKRVNLSAVKKWLLPGTAALLAVVALCLTVALLNRRSQQELPQPPIATELPTESTNRPELQQPPAANRDDKLISGQSDDGLTWTMDLDSHTLTVEGTGSMANYEERSSENGPHAPWNQYKDSIYTVVIGEGIDYIGTRAFTGFDKLRSVKLPSTLKYIGTFSFEGCDLQTLSLPEGLEHIDAFAFAGNHALTELVFPDSLRYIDWGSFGDIEGLRSITIGPETHLSVYRTPYVFNNTRDAVIRGYTNSPAEAYARMCGLAFQSIGTLDWTSEGQCGDNVYYQLNRDAGLLCISGTGAMWDFNGTWMEGENAGNWVDGLELPLWSEERESIRSVYIADGVTSVGSSAFENCSNLRDVDFGNTVERIGTQAFLGVALSVLDLPENITDIEGCAFNWCRELWLVRLPEQLGVLHRDAISDCENLSELWIGRSTQIEMRASEDRERFLTNSNMSFPGLTIYGLHYSDAERVAANLGISFRIGARGYAAEAEGQCGPDVWWFKSNEWLFLYGTGQTWLYGVDEEGRKTWASNWSPDLLQEGEAGFYPYRDEIQNICILPGVEQLNVRLFCDMSDLHYVDFGTVKGLQQPFLECNALEYVHLPDTLEYIGGLAFNYCRNLRHITVETGIIYAGAFANCPALESVEFGALTEIEEGADVLDDPYATVSSDHVIFYVRGSDALRYAREHNIPYEIVK